MQKSNEKELLQKLAPVVITFEVKNCTSDVAELNEDPFVQEVAAAFSVNVLIRQNRSSGQPFFVIRGSVVQENNVKEATIRLQQHYMRSVRLYSNFFWNCQKQRLLQYCHFLFRRMLFVRRRSKFYLLNSPPC